MPFDLGIGHFDTERYVCIMIWLASKESDISPRSCVIGPSDEDDIFHLVNFQLFALGPGKPLVYVLEHPFAKTITC